VENGATQFIFEFLFNNVNDTLINFTPIVRSSLTLKERTLIEIPKYSDQFLPGPLIGLMLGDGHIHKNKTRSKKGKQVGKRTLNSRFQFAQSIIHIDYFFYVYNVFSNLCSAKPFFYKRWHKVHQQFYCLLRLFYKYDNITLFKLF